MRSIIFVIFLFIAGQAVAQNVVISGTVFGSNIEQGKAHKIYYTTPGKRFSSKVFILSDVNNKYKITLPLSKIKSDEINELIFTSDTTANPDGENECVHKIHLGKLLADEIIQPRKDVIVRNDLMLDYNCATGLYHGAKEDGLERFIGEYTLIIKDTVYQVFFRDFIYTYWADINKKDEFRMNAESGSWKYDESEKTLTIKVWKRRNKDYGLMLSVKKEYVFQVIETESGIQFKSDKYVLEKE